MTDWRLLGMGIVLITSVGVGALSLAGIFGLALRVFQAAAGG